VLQALLLGIIASVFGYTYYSARATH
jgi:hypothetical protein